MGSVKMHTFKKGQVVYRVKVRDDDDDVCDDVWDDEIP
jgi:hypothetical protein